MGCSEGGSTERAEKADCQLGVTSSGSVRHLVDQPRTCRVSGKRGNQYTFVSKSLLHETRPSMTSTFIY